jgi:hypothetical protein
MLLRVDDYQDNSKIGWNYYPETDLMAYSLGGGHPYIESRVVDLKDEQPGEIIPGFIRQTIHLTSVIIRNYGCDLSSKERTKLLRNLKDLIDEETINLGHGSSIYFDQEERGKFIDEFEEFQC